MTLVTEVKRIWHTYGVRDQQYVEAAQFHRERNMLMREIDEAIMKGEPPFKNDWEEFSRQDDRDRNLIYGTDSWLGTGIQPDGLRRTTRQSPDHIERKFSYGGMRTIYAAGLLLKKGGVDPIQIRGELEAKIGQNPDLGKSAINAAAYFLPASEHALTRIYKPTSIDIGGQRISTDFKYSGTKKDHSRVVYVVLIAGRTNPKRASEASNTTERIVQKAITELKRTHNLGVAPADYNVDDYSADIEKLTRVFKKHGIEIPPILNYHND